MKIKSRLLAAAQHCQAKNDVRYYLNGIRITRKHIWATNGHVAIQMDHSQRVRNPITININGKVPSKAMWTKFSFGKDGKKDGLAKHYDSFGFLISVHTIDVIDGKYPDLSRDGLFGDMDLFSFENPMPAMNSEYMSLPKKLFPKDKFCAVRPAPRESINESVLFVFGDFVKHEYGDPKLIVMPMRW